MHHLLHSAIICKMNLNCPNCVGINDNSGKAFISYNDEF